jgi:hypothetical protein
MIRHASPAKPVGALAQSMGESASLSLLVPTVGGVSLLAARSLSAGGAAVALSTVTLAADPKETAATSSATKSHSENDFGHGVPLRMTDDVTLHESRMRCAPAGQMMIFLFPPFPAKVQKTTDSDDR